MINDYLIEDLLIEDLRRINDKGKEKKEKWHKKWDKKS